MKDLTELKVEQIKLFSVDVIPFSYLVDEVNIVALKDCCEFKSFLPILDGNGKLQSVNFRNGVFAENGERHIVNQLTIAERKVDYEVMANSKIASKFYEQIRRVIVSFDKEGIFKKSLPIFQGEVTSCVVTLNVDFIDTFSPKLVKYLKESVAKKTEIERAKTRVRPIKFSALISYLPTDESYDDQYITISRKLFTIEPKPNSGEKERKYYTESPTDSETHLALIEEFEKIFANKKSKR